MQAAFKGDEPSESQKLILPGPLVLSARAKVLLATPYAYGTYMKLCGTHELRRCPLQ
jgi:hypothetical protein